MKRLRYLSVALVLVGPLMVESVNVARAAGGGRLTSAGSVTLSGLAPLIGSDAIGTPEFAPSVGADGAAAVVPSSAGKKVDGAQVTSAGPEMTLTFAGLNHRDQRLANGGNQFSLEPPDQALCVGPNHVLEGVNDALRVYSKTTGQPLTGTLSLSELFGYAPPINRTTRVYGPEPTDPVCYYDAASGRYFFAMLTLEQTPAGNLTGKNHIDLAVSSSSDPTGTWARYKLAVQNDGSDGTPNHGCDLGPCIGDYPHIGADQNGIYITTNEYSFFGDGTHGGASYTGSQIYAFSKRQLVAGSSSPTLVSFENPTLGAFRSFTVWPAISPAGQFATANGGTEYFLSSTLGDGSETGNTAPSENRIGVWSLTNTASLNSATPSLRLQNTLIRADTYALPPKATQKAGPSPLRECLNDQNMFGPGVGCWALFLNAAPAPEASPSVLDSNDTRMQQVVYSNGRLWGSLDTAVRVEGSDGTNTRAGALWFSVQPKFEGTRLTAETKRTGYVAIGDNDVIYPAIGVSSSGAVVMAATVTGKDHYPSAAYSILTNGRPTVKIVSEGIGPDDGFSGTQSIGGGRPRWGDYGAVSMDGGTLWIASESIEQSCTFNQYVTSPIGSCGGTRTAFANWATRVSSLNI